MRAFFSLVAFTAVILSQGAVAAVPVGDSINSAFSGRRVSGQQEVALRHRIETDDGTVEVEERIYFGAGPTKFLYRSGNKQVAASAGARGVYRFEGGEEMGGRSTLFAKTFTARNGTDFLNQLLAEQFVRKDQLSVYRPSYNPNGDPKTWKSKESVLRHGDVKLARVRGNIGALVVGAAGEGGPRRSVVVDQDGRGVLRLEWNDGGSEVASWDFDGFAKFGAEGTFPRHAFLRQGNRDVIRTDLLAVRSLNPRQTAEATAALRAAGAEGPSGSLQRALTVLLSRR